MPRPQLQRFNGGSIELNYAEWQCAGSPLLLLHGLGARWQVFGPLIPSLSTDWHLYAPDLRGHGISARASGDYALADYASDIQSFLEQVVREPAVLVGHSLGGWICLMLAGRMPGLVRAVVVLDSSLYPGRIDPGMALSYLDNMPVALRGLATALSQVDPEALNRFRDGRLALDYQAEPTLKSVSCPVLLLQGDPVRGALMSDADVTRARTLLSEVEHEKFEGIGHGMHLENIDPVLGTIQTFLDQLLIKKRSAVSPEATGRAR
jgi:pimeloyl-ACP methyl ester carboxylesterase